MDANTREMLAEVLKGIGAINKELLTHGSCLATIQASMVALQSRAHQTGKNLEQLRCETTGTLNEFEARSTRWRRR